MTPYCFQDLPFSDALNLLKKSDFTQVSFYLSLIALLSHATERDNMASSVYVYILTNRRRGVLYTGVASDLCRRIYEHRIRPHGFVRCYGLYELVFYTGFRQKWYAIEREKAMKRWLRKMKIERIEEMNPLWEDLAADWKYTTDLGEVVTLGSLSKQKPRRVARHCYKYARHRRKYI